MLKKMASEHPSFKVPYGSVSFSVSARRRVEALLSSSLPWPGVRSACSLARLGELHGVRLPSTPRRGPQIPSIRSRSACMFSQGVIRHGQTIEQRTTLQSTTLGTDHVTRSHGCHLLQIRSALRC